MVKNDSKIINSESDLVRLFRSGSGAHVSRYLGVLRNPMKKINFPVRTVIAGYNLGKNIYGDRMIGVFTEWIETYRLTIYDYAEISKYMGA